MGPEAITPRSTYTDWNNNAELYAFGKRLGEEFDMSLLKQAFTHRTYVVQEEQKQLEVGIEEPVVEIADNRTLIDAGDQLMNDFVKQFVKQTLPSDAPTSLVGSVVNYLMSDEVLFKVSSHIGTKDLILSSDSPVDQKTLVDTFKAIVGALAKSKNEEAAQLFVRDFVCTELNQKDYTDWWDMPSSIDDLKRICRERNIAEPEPRVIGECGKNTILASFNVGIYCNKKMLGSGFGETYDIAIEEAAKNCIREIYKIQPHQQIVKF